MFAVEQEFLFDSAGYESINCGKFCMEAWDAINRYVYAALQGGSIMRDWANDENFPNRTDRSGGIRGKNAVEATNSGDKSTAGNGKALGTPF